MKKHPNRPARAFFTLSLAMALALASSGCRSRVVDTTIVNEGPVLHVLELDYPSASFGADSLAPGSRYHYRFQIQGSGPVTLHFDDSFGKSHTEQGPTLNQGQEGSLVVTIDESNQVRWSTQLK